MEKKENKNLETQVSNSFAVYRSLDAELEKIAYQKEKITSGEAMIGIALFVANFLDIVEKSNPKRKGEVLLDFIGVLKSQFSTLKYERK